jgi:hypothetical protein
MIWLAQFAATLGGRLSIVGGAVAALFTAYQLTKHQGVKQERVRVEIQGKKVDAQAGSKRAAAERDPDGVLKRYFRD